MIMWKFFPKRIITIRLKFCNIRIFITITQITKIIIVFMNQKVYNFFIIVFLKINRKSIGQGNHLNLSIMFQLLYLHPVYYPFSVFSHKDINVTQKSFVNFTTSIKDESRRVGGCLKGVMIDLIV